MDTAGAHVTSIKQWKKWTSSTKRFGYCLNFEARRKCLSDAEGSYREYGGKFGFGSISAG